MAVMEVGQIPWLVWQEQILNYTWASSLVLLYHEWLLNLPEEVEFIWKSESWSFMTVLYGINRYSPFIDTWLNIVFLFPNASTNACSVSFRVASWMGALGLLCSEAVVAVRTYALYDRSQRVLAFLLAISLAFAAGGLTCYGVWMRNWQWGEPLAPGLSGCRLISQSAIQLFPFVGIAVFETLIVIMTLVKGVQTFREARTPLVQKLYTDGVVFFILLMVLSIITIVSLVSPVIWNGVPLEMTRVLHSTVACRIILHLRHAAAAAPDLTVHSGRVVVRHMSAGALPAYAERHRADPQVESGLVFHTQADADAEALSETESPGKPGGTGGYSLHRIASVDEEPEEDWN